MKKLIALVLALLMALALTVPALAAEEETLISGSLTHLGMDVEDMQASIDEHMPESTDGSVPHIGQRVYYNSLSELLMALDAGLVFCIEADEPTVQYVLSQTDAYVEHHPESDIYFDYSMLFLDEDAALCDQFSEAIKAMKDDGTLDELAATYIDGVIAGDEIEAVDFPDIGEELSDDAETVTVAVTGDLPPMDYVDDAGYAAGFNTAVLAEISQRLGVNIEFIQVDSSARALALASGRADVVFWVQSNAGEEGPIQGLDIPEGTIASEPYYTTTLCFLGPADGE